MKFKTLLVGCGNMGQAMLRGWLNKGFAPGSIAVVNKSLDRLGGFQDEGVHCYASSVDIRRGFKPDAIVFAVKPNQIAAISPEYKKYAKKGSLIISVAAGIKLAELESSLDQSSAVVRTMPNTPAAIGRGMLVSVANQNVSDEQREICDQLMAACGETAWIEKEEQMDAVTGLSGSGPAYVFYLIEAMKKAGVANGLPEDLALKLAKQTVLGAGELASQSDLCVGTLRENVTSPNGTTAAGLEVLMAEDGLKPLMERTVRAATTRSIELSKNS
ncbi:pyrroline-5-carboxylate reductase [Sneathiella limimaris]|uniref:pyrroline-5-carboxylate reductase n=1 Tax=Sneathiella limimaris TaxID=1964213 RepID=UPI00146B40C2|nr:pyrroline-5-carboxylate reductase [Sneathiella limimaris]